MTSTRWSRFFEGNFTILELKSKFKDRFVEEKSTYERLCDLDLFGIYTCLHQFAYYNYFHLNKMISSYNEDKETYIALWCAGVYDKECKAPTITQVRKHEYYSDIDFTRLLIRGYDLVTILELDINKMFKRYCKIDGNRLFGKETKNVFIRKNDPKILNEMDPDILETFGDL